MKIKTKFFKTLTFRLTIWYVILFSFFSVLVFSIVYISLVEHLSERLDTELLNEARELKCLYVSHGLDALKAEFSREAKSQGTNRIFYRLISPDLKIILTTYSPYWSKLLKDKRFLLLAKDNTHMFHTLKIPGHHYYVRIICERLPDGNILQIGMTMKDNERLMEKYRETFATAFAVMLICGTLIGWFIVKGAIKGVQRVTNIVATINASDLSSRVPLKNEGLEIDELANSFNKMLDRIEKLVTELKEVTDNIAHDLRSPITRIRGIAETTITGNENINNYREMTLLVIEECDRLIELINNMLDISQIQAGVAKLVKEKINIVKIIKDASELFQPVAEDKNITINLHLPTKSIFIYGDKSKIQRSIANILDNAIKYTLDGGKIDISLYCKKDLIEIEIKDTGIGISKQDLPRIFDRFYRCDKSRASQGNGLGLSLALAFIKAHGGDIKVSSKLGQGSTFNILLPKSSILISNP